MVLTALNSTIVYFLAVPLTSESLRECGFHSFICRLLRKTTRCPTSWWWRARTRPRWARCAPGLRWTPLRSSRRRRRSRSELWRQGKVKPTSTWTFAEEETAECYSAGEQRGPGYGLVSEVLPTELELFSQRDEVFSTSTYTSLKKCTL